jgi:FtsH-binding integral membrane protein
MRASYFIMPYRGQVTKYDRILYGIAAIGLIITIAASMAIGMSTEHWPFSLIFIVVYLVAIAIVGKVL